jgi:hypothetical protein
VGGEAKEGKGVIMDKQDMQTEPYSLLTESDWLQIEQAASGCISGTSDDWPALRHAVSLVLGHPLHHRKPAAWLQGFCEGVMIQAGKLQEVQAELGAVKLCPADFLGKAILLHLAIKELTSELTVEICQNCPRLVLMVLLDLERRAEEIVEAIKSTNNG